ncbi:MULTISPECIES: hypothetical protein [unclassified Rhodococcus (in: high G+C Gram-positive bacteria)]|nr:MULTISPECIES: hypothetical protein [unclassified Rhodococcus (in: high G+C Gram-positive bacteria)]
MTNIVLLLLVLVTGLAVCRALHHHFEHATAPPNIPPTRFR